MASEHSYVKYTTTPAVSGKIIVLCNGNEIGAADDLTEAAEVAASDVVSGWPEVSPDFLSDLSDEIDFSSHVDRDALKASLVGYFERLWNAHTPVRTP